MPLKMPQIKISLSAPNIFYIHGKLLLYDIPACVWTDTGY